MKLFSVADETIFTQANVCFHQRQLSSGSQVRLNDPKSCRERTKGWIAHDVDNWGWPVSQALNYQLSQAPEIKVILIDINVIKNQSPEMGKSDETKAIANHTRATTKPDRSLKLWWH